MRVIVVGGGWAGCAAAASAARAGAEVTLLERTSMVLGTGLVGGIMRNNGRFTASEELIAMGGGDMIEVTDACARHKNVDFPGHKHASLYDIASTPIAVLQRLEELGVNVVFKARISKAKAAHRHIVSVMDDNKRIYAGDVFIDTTGTAGPVNNCVKYGNGCAMCVLRCPSFGGRVSLAGLVGIREFMGVRPDGTVGAMSGSCKLYKESLSKELQDKLNRDGVVVVRIPEAQTGDKLSIKACQQYALKEYRENLVVLDTGHAKLMTPYYDLAALRQVPGFEKARYEDPYAGGEGNSMRYFSMVSRDDTMRVRGADNLFCGGEKAGLLVGHTEAIVTGTLAGCNAVRQALGMELLVIPDSLATGDAISYVREAMKTREGMGKKYTFSGSVYFNKMKEKNLYTTDIGEIRKRVDVCGFSGALNKKLV